MAESSLRLCKTKLKLPEHPKLNLKIEGYGRHRHADIVVIVACGRVTCLHCICDLRAEFAEIQSYPNYFLKNLCKFEHVFLAHMSKNNNFT